MIATQNNKTVLQNNVLSRNPAGAVKSFRTAITITESDQETTTITYDVSVACTEIFPSGKYSALVAMTNFLVNGFEPDLVMEELARKCRKPLETVHYLVGSNGIIIEILNHSRIVEDWYDTKMKLESEYTGDNFRKYIALNEAVILNPDALLAALKKDIFISQYFYPLYEGPFFEYTKKQVEQITFFNIGYEIDMLLSLNENASLSGNVAITKAIDNKYDHEAMPIEQYTSEYVLNQDLHIVNIKGVFENYGRKYNFAIAEKYV